MEANKRMLIIRKVCSKEGLIVGGNNDKNSGNWIKDKRNYLIGFS